MERRTRLLAYATRYTVYFLAGLETALGKDFGLSNIEGFSRAGHFRVYSCGTAGKTFNYADAGSNIEETPGMFWLARRFKQPVYAWQSTEATRKSAPSACAESRLVRTESNQPPICGWAPDQYFKGCK